jgi:hypothetical protein
MIVCRTQFHPRVRALAQRHRYGTKAGNSPLPSSPYSAASDHRHANPHQFSFPPPQTEVLYGALLGNVSDGTYWNVSSSSAMLRPDFMSGKE